MDAAETGEGAGSKEQLNQETKTTQQILAEQQLEKKRKRRKRKRWNPKAANTSIYISGLPDDVTEEELANFCAKCGILKLNDDTGKPRDKIYLDEHGRPKGDAVAIYFKEESVDLALTILDGANFRPDKESPVTISKAVFQQKGNFQETSRPKKKNKLLDENRLLSWDEDDRVHVVFKHFFDPKEGWTDLQFFPELKQEIREECEKVGEVELVTIFENHPDGVVVVKFKRGEDAAECIEVWISGLSNRNAAGIENSYLMRK